MGLLSDLWNSLTKPEQNTPAARSIRTEVYAHKFVDREVDRNVHQAELKGKQGDREVKEAPITGGRSSVPDGIDYLANFTGFGSMAKPEWVLEWLDALYHLAMHNADVSFAVENIVNLGATDFKYYFKDNTSEADQKAIIMHIKDVSDKWYPYSGGLGSLINDLFAELAIAGCISDEIVVEDDLSGVYQVVSVAPKNIRFVWDMKHGKFMPYQKTANILGLQETGNGWLNGMKELNPNSYKYIALRRFKGNPYAVPPFLSAIEPLLLQRDMLDSFRNVMKKMGLAGFLQVLVTAPARIPGEDADAYYARMKTYLEKNVSPEVDKQISKGYAVGFKGTHEFQVQSNAGNAQGAETFYDMNEKHVISGVKQDPAMLGRQMTTTETFGRVILAKLTNQTANYQKLVAKFIGYIIRLECQCAGLNYEAFDFIQFDKPMIGDADKEETARSKQIANVASLVTAGYISRTQGAQELGYDKPFEDDATWEAKQIPTDPLTGKPIVPNNDSPENPTADGSSKKKSESNTASWKMSDQMFDSYERMNAPMATMISLAESQLHRFAPEFDYHLSYQDAVGDSDQWFEKFSADQGWADPKLEKMLKQYVFGTRKQYRTAIGKATDQIVSALAKMPANATQQEVQDKVMYTLFRNWKGNFSNDQAELIDKMVEKVYNTFRTDKTVFGANADKIPDATFTLADKRAKNYFKDSDDLYLGKFITDKDTQKKVLDFIRDEYLEEATPIGNNEKAFKKFRDNFTDLMELEDYKIRRIVDTSVNKMRNYASVNYMSQAEVTEFQIVGVDDKRTCEWCKSMQNRTFSVETALETINEELNAPVESIPLKFLTSSYKAADLDKMTDEALQKAGYSKPPYHPLCRDSIVAVI